MKNALAQLTRRLDGVHVEILNPYGVPATLVANEEVQIEVDGIQQLLEFMSLQQTLREIWTLEQSGQCKFWGDIPGEILKMILTPDFHKGGGIPIGSVADVRGFVIPKAVGTDVNCGMRLMVLDITVEELLPHLDRLGRILREIFFGGKRNIPMSPKQREAMLREGLMGVLDQSGTNAGTGLWRYYDQAHQADELERVHADGSFFVPDSIRLFDDFIGGSGASDGRDGQLGSVGGGNHFVEIQMVQEILDGITAHTWGVAKGKVTIMVHTGSVSLGHTVGNRFHDVAKEIYPKGLRHPDHGFYVLPTTGPFAEKSVAYLRAMRMAANFAFSNRLFLGLMAVRAISEVLGREIEHSLVYDSPHNLIFDGAEDHRFIHRKGACPALGMQHMHAERFRYLGAPVIIPGSMGDASYLMAGLGNENLLCSACHGAGRSITRGAARLVSDEEYRRVMQPIRVITNIDPDSPQVRSRPDILAEYHARVREEAPNAYKPITPVIESVETASIARKVARLWPLMTVKG
jgi:tRNA-splicing ligase RtcB